MTDENLTFSRVTDFFFFLLTVTIIIAALYLQEGQKHHSGFAATVLTVELLHANTKFQAYATTDTNPFCIPKTERH